jgi:hypothetical protein
MFFLNILESKYNCEAHELLWVKLLIPNDQPSKIRLELLFSIFLYAKKYIFFHDFRIEDFCFILLLFMILKISLSKVFQVIITFSIKTKNRFN